MFILSGLSEAVSFLTVFKLKRKGKSGKSGTEDEGKDTDKGEFLYITRLKKSIKYFPPAGFLIGMVSASIFYVFNKFLPVQPSILVSIFFLYIITGGLHFDGLSDTFDGFFAYLKSGDKNRFYKAMKDVNTGAAGNMAVIFYVLIMWSLIASVDPAQSFNFVSGGAIPDHNFFIFNRGVNLTYLTLLTFPMVGRYSIVVMSYFSNTPDNFKGIGAIFTEGTDIWSFIAASIFTLIIIYFFLKLAGIFSLLITVFIILFAAFYFGKRFGGVNGDMLGFTVKLSEVVFTVVLIGFTKILY